MKTLARPADRTEIAERLGRLQPESPRRWGRMSAHQAVCHMSDAFRVVLGARKVARPGSLVPPVVRRWLAIRLPLAWPQGIPTWPEIDAFVGGTKPTTFEADRSELERLLRAFVAEGGALEGRFHATLGAMTEAEWLRWGYLHLDHHLRQFGR